MKKPALLSLRLALLAAVAITVAAGNEQSGPAGPDADASKGRDDAQRRHDANPVAAPGTAPRRYRYSDFNYPRPGDTINLTGLTLRRRQTVSLATKRATVVAELVDSSSPPLPARQKPAPWVPANGATLYRSFVFMVEDLPAGNVFNNNTDKVADPRSWTWIRYPKNGTNLVTVCYTSRGMIATPDMPQRGMKPVAVTR